jgi:hypothetical protein
VHSGQNRRRGLLLGCAASPNQIGSLRAHAGKQDRLFARTPVFSYRVGIWTKPRRVIAKVEWHPGELYPRVGFIATNVSRPAERVVAFYNKRDVRAVDQVKQTSPPDAIWGARNAVSHRHLELPSNPKNHYKLSLGRIRGIPRQVIVFLFRPCGVGCYCDKLRPLEELP